MAALLDDGAETPEPRHWCHYALGVDKGGRCRPNKLEMGFHLANERH